MIDERSLYKSQRDVSFGFVIVHVCTICFLFLLDEQGLKGSSVWNSVLSIRSWVCGRDAQMMGCVYRDANIGMLTQRGCSHV